MNGFYMSMREKFTKPEATLAYYVVEFEADKLSWEDFRGKVLGATDPATADEGALRRTIFDTYKELGLTSEPNVGDNGMHASASPFEALAERMNWLSAELEGDDFGKAMLAAGLSKETIMSWTKDPQVEIGDGKKGSLFDQLEDMQSTDCLKKAAGLAGASGDVAAVGKNTAFVFIKPHAVTDKTKALVAAKFAEVGITILKEGELDGKTIGDNKLIDNHYYAIAVKASLTLPKDLNVPDKGKAEFEAKFGMTWEKCLEDGLAFNALDGCTKLGLSGDEMDGRWAVTKKAGNLVKFGGGFYCGKVTKA